jgi:hypothetical protein
VPAERGGAGGNAPSSTSPAGQVNLDGSISGPGPANGAAPADGGASAPLRLDLHGAGGGPSLGRTRSGLVPLLKAPPDDADKSKLAKDLEKAGRADCKEAYQGNGLLAVVPLARDAVTGKGCKW